MKKVKSFIKKVIASLLTGVLLVGGMVGCSKDSGNNSDNSGKDKVLDIVWFSDGKEGKSFRRLADKYEADNSHIKINMIEVPYDDLNNKIKNMINGKEIPAMARLTNMGMFQNQLLDLGEYVSDRDAFINNFGEGLRFIFDDKILGAPMDVTANGLIYNKDAFAQAGVKVPESPDEIWNWTEWKEAMQKVMDGSDCKYGLVFDKSPMRFSTLLYEAGGGLLNEDMTKSDFNTPENRKAIEFFKELHDDGIIPESIWLGAENPNNLFRTGQVAMHFAGSWMIANYKDEITDFKWGVTYLPKEVQRATVPGGKWIGAFDHSGVEQEAANFIEWISEPENNAIYCKENMYLSQVKGNESLDYDYGSDYFSLFSDELKATNSRPGAEWGYQTFTGMVQNDIRDQLIEVLAGQLSVDDYMNNMDELFTEKLSGLEK